MPASPVRKRSRSVLLLIDVVNHFEFPDGGELLRNALALGPQIARLKARARRAGVATIYVNDNFGQWRSDAGKVLAYCTRPDAIGRNFVSLVSPDDEDYFILKPMHSAFYQTPLETLLHFLGSSSLVLAGISTNSCIVCTAHDAHMRNINFTVVSDGCAARSKEEHLQALRHIRSTTSAKVRKAASIRF